MKVDHIGIAVKSIESGIKIWETIFAGDKAHSYKIVGITEVESQRVKVSALDVGGVKIELIEPTCEDSNVNKFIEKRGEGLHHICFEVKNIEVVLSELQNSGIKLIDSSPRPGAFGKKIAFLHPSSTCGVLVELAEKG